jgi:three-Cys-motif partner protein
MAVPSALLWPRDPHTKAKHRVLKGYLDAWWPILLSANDEVTYAEGYAGPGEYQGGEDGSPVVALRSLLQREHRPVPLVGKTAKLVLVEEREDRLNNCVEQIRQRVGPLPSSVYVRAEAGRCESELLRALRDAGAFGSPMLVNLDPFATGVPYDVVREVAQNRSSEVLISFMMQWFIRWAANEELDQGDRMFGSTDWRQVTDVPPERKRRWLIDRYRQRLHEAGFAHTVWFELVDEGGRAFALIFATTNDQGLLKMKESFWRVDPVSGVHFRDPRDPGQMAFDVGDDPYLAPLRNLLGEYMHGRRSMSVEELRAWTLEQTVFLPPHAMRVLNDWKSVGRLIVDPPGRVVRASRVTLLQTPLVETTRPAEQQGLF